MKTRSSQNFLLGVVCSLLLLCCAGLMVVSWIGVQSEGNRIATDYVINDLNVLNVLDVCAQALLSPQRCAGRCGSQKEPFSLQS